MLHITDDKEPIMYARNQTSYTSLIKSLKAEQYMEQSADDFISGFNGMKYDKRKITIK